MAVVLSVRSGVRSGTFQIVSNWTTLSNAICRISRNSLRCAVIAQQLNARGRGSGAPGSLLLR